MKMVYFCEKVHFRFISGTFLLVIEWIYRFFA